MRHWISSLVAVSHPDDDVRRRSSILASIALILLIASVCSLPLSVLLPDPLESCIIGGFYIGIFSVILLLAHRGRVTVGGGLLIGTLTLVLFATIWINQPGLQIGMFLVLPLLAASLVLPPRHTAAVLVAMLAGLGLLVGVRSAILFASAADITTLVLIVLLLVITAALSILGSSATACAVTEARAAAADLAEANAKLEDRVAERTAALETALAEVQARAGAQAQLLADNAAYQNAIRELSVPVLPIGNDALVLPIVGALDSDRLQMLQERALAAMERTRARTLVLDITGVPVVDSQVGLGLLQVAQAAQLLGAQTLLVGIRPEVAQTIVGLGLPLGSMHTAADLGIALGQLQDRQRQPLAI